MSWHTDTADYVMHGVYMGGCASMPPSDMPAVNCCLSAVRSTDECNVPFGDSPLTPRNMDNAVYAFKQAMHLRADHEEVLVRCQMGLNRSGLIVAGILQAEGAPHEYVIDRIQRARGVGALNNLGFRRFLAAGGFAPFVGEKVHYRGSIEECHGPATVWRVHHPGMDNGNYWRAKSGDKPPYCCVDDPDVRMDLVLADGVTLQGVRRSSILRGRDGSEISA